MNANLSDPRRRASEPQRLESVPVDLIDRNPHQPRQTFEPEQLDMLAQSMVSHGLMQPVVLRRAGTRYQLVAGERRWRAAQRAGWHEIPALIRNVSDLEAAELALVENELRINVNPIETARAIARLIEKYRHTHEDVATILGVERPSISNLLRLLTLDESVQALIGDGEGRISAGHAKVLVGLARGQQRTLADRALREGWSVREIERQVKLCTASDPRRAPASKDSDVRALEEQLSEEFGQRVDIDWNGEGRGRLTIGFHSAEEFDGVLDKLRSRLLR